MVIGGVAASLLIQTGLFGPVDVDPASLPRMDQVNLDPTVPSVVDQQTDVAAAELSTMDMAKRVVLAQVIGQLPVLLYLIWRVSAVPRGLRLIGIIPGRPGRDLLWGMLGLIVSVPLVMGTIQAVIVVGQVFGQEPPVIGHEMLRAMNESDSLLATALIACSAVLIAPVLEEAIFRGLFQSVLAEVLGVSMRWPIVLVSALVFSLIHIGAADWQTLPGLFVLGVVLGWMYERSGSLWPSIVVHVGFNALNIVIMLLVTTANEATT